MTHTCFHSALIDMPILIDVHETPVIIGSPHKCILCELSTFYVHVPNLIKMLVNKISWPHSTTSVSVYPQKLDFAIKFWQTLCILILCIRNG